MLTDRDLKDARDDLDILIRLREKSLTTLIDVRTSSPNQDPHLPLQPELDGLREIRNALALLRKARRLILLYRASQHRR